MKKWEYLRMTVTTEEDSGKTVVRTGIANGEQVLSKGPMSSLQGYLAQLGSGGWEMVGVYTWGSGWVEVYHFKRPVGE